MASSQHVLLSPAELAYLHASLSLIPPIRPDGRSPTQFRPLVAETGILPGTNGSARICFADGTEAIVGVKAEVERTALRPGEDTIYLEEGGLEGGDDGEEGSSEDKRKGDASWVEMTVEIPGLRDDDSGTAFLSAMLSEALLADGEFARRLWINRRFHWKLYLDIILISPPLSYPLPLLSLTTHLALLSTRLPRLKSEGDEDPFFDDDWAAAPYLFPRSSETSAHTTTSTTSTSTRPPITLLVMAVANNIIFDPSKEELAVADAALAVSVTSTSSHTTTADADPIRQAQAQEQEEKEGRNLRLLSIRTIDPPSRLTPPGVANAANAAYGASLGASGQQPQQQQQKSTAVVPVMASETEAVEGVWRPPRGGAKRAVLGALVQKVLEGGGVVDEVLDALEGVDLG
ncbi:ribosomal protein S5 domain 2-type protein [Dichotomopilus funicola]|uniref:Ribosomal RNA-processing protein 42 n=1 Tax=Dichotomopilus funicola TaxID=1934379 RepID=A0AAN6ZKV4_9PEZI|nr:ribosomal protein S5 domain 2-type protein [Dichotomopilus funicola]